MLPLTKEALLDLSMNLMFYFTIGSLGAFLKDLYETMTKKNERIRLGEILIGGACATFICFGLQDTWFKGWSLNTMVLVTFVCGILGFELFGNLTTVSKFKDFIGQVLEFKNRFNIEYQKPEEKKESDDPTSPDKATPSKKENIPNDQETKPE